MKKITFVLPVSLLFSLLVTPQAFAEFTKSKCEYALLGNDVIQVNRQWQEESRRCFISVTPRNSVELKYRDYYFDNTGYFMVFNSYGYGPDATSTGARVFFMFPQIEEYPDFSFEENGDVIVKTVSGHRLRISGQDFALVSLSDGRVQEKPLSPNNKGGVEIRLTKGYWIDAGFKMGGTRLDNPKNKSDFRSGNSTKSCSLVNSSFLTYTSSYGDFDLKYTGDTLTQYLKSKCPGLNL